MRLFAAGIYVSQRHWKIEHVEQANLVNLAKHVAHLLTNVIPYISAAFTFEPCHQDVQTISIATTNRPRSEPARQLEPCEPSGGANNQGKNNTGDDICGNTTRKTSDLVGDAMTKYALKRRVRQRLSKSFDNVVHGNTHPTID